MPPTAYCSRTIYQIFTCNRHPALRHERREEPVRTVEADVWRPLKPSVKQHHARPGRVITRKYGACYNVNRHSVGTSSSLTALSLSVNKCSASEVFMGLFRDSSSAKALEEAASELNKLRQEYQALEDKYSKRKQICQQLEKENKSLEHDAQGMARQLNELSMANRSLEKHAREATKDAGELQATCNELQDTLKSSEEENQNIKAQVIQYKAMVSMTGRQDEQTADDVIAANASEIFHSLQNFVVQRFRRATISKLAGQSIEKEQC